MSLAQDLTNEEALLEAQHDLGVTAAEWRDLLLDCADYYLIGRPRRWPVSVYDDTTQEEEDNG